jgi:hypothetical protein
MERRSFVRVVAQSGDKESVGTGYRLSRERVLTAHHVIVGASEVIVEMDRKDGTRHTAEASVLWKDEELDAAVLGCTTREPVATAFTHLARGPLQRASEWASQGFAGTVPEAQCLCDSMAALNGKAFALDAHQHRLELTVEAAPKNVEHWSGISGAPVFIGKWLYGIIRQAPTSFQERLYATPTHLLFEQRDFIKALDLVAISKWKPLLGEVRQLLVDDDTAARALAAQRQDWQLAFADSGCEGLVTALERGMVDEVLLALHKAHGTLAKAGPVRSAKTVEKVLDLTIPVLYDRQLVYSPPGDAGGVVLRIPVATPTVAEIAMASVDGRALRYRPVRDPKVMPEPLAQVPKTLETGIDYKGSRAFKDFVDHLASQFLDEEPRRLLQHLPEERRYDQLAGLVNDEIEWQAGDGGILRHYFLFDSRFAQDHAPLLKRLRTSLPALRLLELTSDDVRSDRRLCLPLRDLLYRSQNYGKTDDEIS